MKNLQTILNDNKLEYISVTTSVSIKVLQYTIPPSDAAFTKDALSHRLPKVVDFLKNVASYVLMVNVYPYDDYVADPVNNRLDFMLFATNKMVLIDGNLNYTNLFDTTQDAFYGATERALAPDVYLAVSQTGFLLLGMEMLQLQLLHLLTAIIL
ncbi:hypothetical protein ACH5RR_003993 [Cinchona calisaya]|uniref:(1->3)-beta-glucan endohydrolase n=1 Tax=Cinchona calisaya TaxID=153742 RepID=A0ABD3AWF2_9GENT